VVDLLVVYRPVYWGNRPLALCAATQVPRILRSLVPISSRTSMLHLAGLRWMDGCGSSKKASVCSSAKPSGLRM
jgi:hypothetical protein